MQQQSRGVWQLVLVSEVIARSTEQLGTKPGNGAASISSTPFRYSSQTSTASQLFHQRSLAAATIGGASRAAEAQVWQHCLPPSQPWKKRSHLETGAKLLILLEASFAHSFQMRVEIIR
jgi:hypothetical protein